MGQSAPLEAGDYEGLLKRLTAYAVRLFSVAGLAGAASVLPGIGISPEDLAYETYLKFLTDDGVNYHSSKGPLFPFLAMVMEKDFIDRLKLHAHARSDVIDPVVENDTDDGDGLRARKGLADYPAQSKSADGIVTEDEFKTRIYEKVACRPELKDVVEAVMELDLLKREEIADALGIDVSEVTNRRKVLKRKLAGQLNIKEER